MKKPLDLYDTYSMLANWPKQFEPGFRLGETINLNQPQEIVITGPADCLVGAHITKNLIEDQTKTPILIKDDQSLPDNIDQNSLIIVVSFDGNESQLLENTKKTSNKNIPTVIITTGGKLEILALERNLPLILIPKDNKYFTPLTTTGYIIGVLTQLLINTKVIKDINRNNILEATKNISELYLPQLTKKLSDPIKNHTPLIYVPDNYWSVKLSAKNKINYNVKIPAFSNTLSQLIHNEIIGFNNPQTKYYALLTQDSDDQKIVDQVELVSEIFDKQKITYKILDMPGDNKFEKILGSIWLLDWIIYWLSE